MNTLFGKPRFKTGRTRLFILLPAALCGILFLYACDFPGSPTGGESYLTINLSGAPADTSRAVISNATIATLEYEITFTGSGAPFTEEITGGSTSMSITLAPGTWTIDVDAYATVGVPPLIGSGTATVTLARGQYKSVPIEMEVERVTYEPSLSTYYLHNEADLRRLIGDDATDLSIGAGKTFILENDITITDPWMPIGYATSFNAIFDGAGKTITISGGFSPAALGGQYLGLFGQTGAGTIKNLTIVYNNLTATSTYTGSPYDKIYLGGAAAHATETTFTNVHVKGSIDYTLNTGSYQLFIGGVAGIMENALGNTAITQCSFQGNLKGTGAYIDAGGILGSYAGTPPYTGRIGESFTAGSIIANSTNDGTAGGIAGISSNGDIENCYSTAAVSSVTLSSSDYSQAGGIIGLFGYSGGKVSKCYALGPVTNTHSSSPPPYKGYAGGIVGENNVSIPLTIENCAALANVGGTGTLQSGRVLGILASGTSTNNYAASDTTLTGSGGTDGITTYALSAFQGSGNQSMYETTLSWTFVNGDWKFIGAYNYPVLSWQTAPPSP
jgi:hypothetical protein